MKNLLSQFVAYYEHNEEFQREMANFQYVIKSGDWVFYKKMLMIIKGVMATDMFSSKYTSLSAEEKDVMQKTYYNIDQILTFLLNPIQWMKSKNKYRYSTNPKGKEKK